MNTKALWSVAVLGAVVLFSACGDGDSTKIKICNQAQVTCLNDRGGEVCSGDGTVKLPFSCADDQKCCDGKNKDCTDADGNVPEKASCVSVDQRVCTPNDTQCGSDQVSLVCSIDGLSWEAVPCASGTGCDNDDTSDTYGTCIPGDGSPIPQVCDADETACADDNTVKSCEPDLTKWVYTACAENEKCDKGACVLDKAKGCVPHSGTCQDLTHLKVCATDGQSEKVTTCAKGTTCEDGGCQGPVCTAGALRCDDVRVGSGFVNALATGTYQAQSLYRCNDQGTAWEISTCMANEICVYDNISVNTVNTYIEALKDYARSDRTSAGNYPVLNVPTSAEASCQTPDCAAPFTLRELFGDSSLPNASGTAAQLTAGSFACGDPTDPAADPLASYSLCEGLPPFNNLHWANYACTAPEQCSYVGGANSSEEGTFVAGPTCTTTCTPGTTACFSETNGGLGGIAATGESTVECDAKTGTYDYSTRTKCLSGDKNPRELWCGPNLMGTAANYNVGTCMEPACAAWFSAYDTFVLPEGVGACAADGQFYPCNPDGSFGDPIVCSECQLATNVQLAQVTNLPETFAGYDPGTCVTCKTDEQRCVFSNNQTPYYQTCADGHWTTKSCSGGALCTEYLDPDTALGATICGAECPPYTAICVGKQIQSCSKDGTLGDAVDCKTGACHSDNESANQGTSGSAFCEAECITGTFQCVMIEDPDNGNAVGPASIACNKQSRFEGDPTFCDYLNVENPEICVDKLGCMQCDPGTFSGKPAARCARDADGVIQPAVQVCKADGTWDKAIDCPGVTPQCSDGSSTGPTCTDLGGGTAGAGGAP